MEHIGGTSRQLVKVEDVYKGTEPAVGQDIYLTCSRWSLSLYSEPYSIERGFVNIMEVGGEYLVFIEKSGRWSWREDSCISGVCGKCIHTNIFISRA